MDKERLALLGASAGIVGVVSFQVLFSVSLLFHPGWRFGLDLMSELGISEPHTWLFNLSVIIMGAMGAAFSLSLLRFLYWSFFGKIAVAIMVAGCTCLFLLGVFTMERRALHDALAWSFFVLTVLGLLVLSIPMYMYWKKARWAFAATLATVVFSVASLILISLGLIMHHQAEVLVVYALGAWIMAISIFMIKRLLKRDLPFTPYTDN
ncbi:MAG: hypothetical protein A4E30_01296 [Methanomassiliicoccales archaeon PtaB.Bin215]|nr:MAG: hypothetical protein A4E30_01296 [Methanomassiliicoccales archaeon PtaB.Bin215]